MRCLPFRTPSPPGRCGLSPRPDCGCRGDIAVIGFDGTELAEVVSPQLTTVEQPSRAIGPYGGVSTDETHPTIPTLPSSG